MRDITLTDIAYRLFRLRRLIVILAFLPMPAIAFAGALGVTTGLGHWALWLVALLACAVRFPHAWVDMTGFALAFSAVLLAAPLGALIGLGFVFGHMLGALGLFFGGMMLTNRLFLLEARPFPMKTLRYRARLRLPAGDLRAATFLRPDAKVGFYRCGPADDEGVFEVVPEDLTPPDPFARRLNDYTDVIEVKLDDPGAEAEARPATQPDHDAAAEDHPFEMRFAACVMREEDWEQELLFMVSDDEAAEPVALRQAIRPKKRGALYEKSETNEALGWITGAGFWLNDVQGDYLTAAIDTQTGSVPKAIRTAPQGSPLSALASWLILRKMEKLADEAEM